MEKSRDAFRTISEVAEWLDVPTHVLRFWESRFSQIKPVKRAGGRRYYRPSDMRLIGGVKTLLHDQGMTIRGVQKVLREQGLKHVSSFSPPLHGDEGDSEAPAVVVQADTAPKAPAPAARSTREAAPDPIEDELSPSVEEEPDSASEPDGPAVADNNDDDGADSGDEAAQAPAAPMFSHRPATPDPAPAPSPEIVAEVISEPQPEPHSDGAPEIESAASMPSIPATPHVTDTDPDDDSAEHVKDPSAAARLRLVPADRLSAHRADLVSAAERLKALLDRVS